MVQKRLFAGIQANHGLGDFVVHILHSFQDPFAAVACGVTVAQFNGFTAASRCARGDGGATHDAAFQQDIALHRGVATAVQNFTTNDVDDCTHVLTFFERENRLKAYGLTKLNGKMIFKQRALFDDFVNRHQAL